MHTFVRLLFLFTVPVLLFTSANSAKNALMSDPFNQAETFQDSEEVFLPSPGNYTKGAMRTDLKNDLSNDLNTQEIALADQKEVEQLNKTILINFNNVGIIEYIRFISKVTNKNFVFDEQDLNFRVTIVSEEPTTLDNVMTALIQILRIRGLQLIEQDNNLIIHRNPGFNGISKISVGGQLEDLVSGAQIITQVFQLNTLSPERAQAIIMPLLSEQALIEVSTKTRHLIITDIVANIKQVHTLLSSIDAPNGGLVIGQYQARNLSVDTLISLAQRLIAPIADNQEFTLVPHPASNSIFVVSNPYIVEKTVSILQHLDLTEGETRVLDINKYTPIELPPKGIAPQEEAPQLQARGQWELSPDGQWVFRPEGLDSNTLPEGTWLLDPQGNWFFLPKGQQPPFPLSKKPGEPIPGKSGAFPLTSSERPKGRWVLDANNNWVYQLFSEDGLKPKRLSRKITRAQELPAGDIERTHFILHKLQYRRGIDIVDSLQKIGQNLRSEKGTTNEDLIDTIQTVQWLETSNSLVLTGTDNALRKVKELIDAIDQPLRQVFIEMLILETSITDSLTYGVTWGTRSGGGNTATQQVFNDPASSVLAGLNTTGVGKIPSATSALDLGYSLAVIGQKITHNGTEFASLSAFVSAVHNKGNTDIVLNPKILTEDNKPAEIFVGRSDPYQTQSIANDTGDIITSNVEYKETGTRLKVTPLLGNNDLITLEIQQEVSRVATNTSGQTTNLTPSTSINRTTTTVHIPNEYFLILSGMIEEDRVRGRNQLPCLGGIPVLGALFSEKNTTDSKTNLMIFIRPQIVDTYEDYDALTTRQQDIWKEKRREKKAWNYEVGEALDFLNIAPECCEVCD